MLNDIENIDESHPSWVRGLKSEAGVNRIIVDARSHPSWVRGLKFYYFRDGLNADPVAPFMGAWIEIPLG